VYLNYWLGNMPIGPTNALLDVLHNHGMMYLQTGNCFDTGSWTRYGANSFSIMSQTYVQQYAQHPAALGYYIMDECVDALIAETEAHHDQLKSWDPQGITFAANLAAGYRDPALWVDAADVMGTDPYPLYGPERAAGYTHFIVADFVSKLRAVAKPDRPVWSVLQFFQFTTDSRMPTPEELRVHAVMSIVEGAQGIFWWDIGVNGLRRLDATTVSTYMAHLKTLTTELAGLEPALIAPEANAALVGNSTRFADPVAGRIEQLEHNAEVEWLFSRESEHGFSRIQWYQAEQVALEAGDTTKSGGLLIEAANVRTRTKVVNGVGYVFAYNYTNTAKPVTFTWQKVPTSVKESKTGQTFPLTGASWSDTFGPYQSRIYLISGAGGTPPPPGSALTLVFTNPASGATVNGTTTVTMSATGGTGYSFKATLDGTQVYAGTSPSFSWNTTTTANGARTLAATVTDAQSRTAAASRAVTVSNTPLPTIDFADVPPSHASWRWIQSLAQTAITGGCATNPALYCPDGTVTRAQMAVFLLRGMAYPGSPNPTPSIATVFADVQPTHLYADWINALFAAGITGGCGTGPARYCPDQAVTRGQMAVFLLRAKHGPAYAPPPPTQQTFEDVALDHPFATWIYRLAAEGITSGCSTNPGRYCPSATVTRAQMAVFLVRTFSLPF
jgi:hypothetical protein